MVGCTEQEDSLEFEADPVVLEEGDREELVLAETVKDSRTDTREPEEIDGEVTVTSHFAAYRRGPARGQPTLVEAFMGRVNGTEGAGSGKVVPGSDAGLDSVTLEFFEGEPTLDGEEFCLTVPGGAPDEEGRIALADTVLMASAENLGQEPVMGRGATAYLVSGPDWLPGKAWIPEPRWQPSTAWIEGSEWVPDDPEDLQVLVVTGEQSFEEVFGRPASDEIKPLNDGDTVSMENTLVATDVATFDAENGGGVFDDPDGGRIFNAGRPAPTGGGTFGLGVLSTPRAEVGGEARNPYASLDLETVLQQGEVMDFLGGSVGMTDGEGLEWLSGPEEVAVESEGLQGEFDVLGEVTDLRTFAGVIGGGNQTPGIGPLLVGLDVARVEHEGDTVIAAGGPGRRSGMPWARSTTPWARSTTTLPN